MSAAQGLLPAGFERLEPFAAHWAAASASERDRLRRESSEADRLAFFDAGKDLLGSALARLDRKPLTHFDARERRLMHLTLSFAHVALAVEIQRDAEERHAQARRHLPITRASADF
jgi:hypothetical protein